MATEKSSLSRAEILDAFQDLSNELGRQAVTGELCLLGGTAMVLAFAARVSTKDVDAIFQPVQIIRDAARTVAETRGFAPNWLNDAAKGFASEHHNTISTGLPQFPHLRLVMPVPEYLLAMKCMASRIGSVEGETDDVQDIAFLIHHLKLTKAGEVMDIVAAYYPAHRIPVKAQYLIEGLFAEGKA